MYIINRNNQKEEVKFDQITERNKKIIKDLNLNIDPVNLSQLVIQGLKNGMTTYQIDELSAETAYHLSPSNPDYEKFACYVMVNNIHKSITQDYKTYLDKVYEQKLVSKNFYNFASNYIDTITSNIDYSMDYKFEYFGLKTIMRGYLLSKKGQLFENGQQMLMRAALSTWGEYDYTDSKYSRFVKSDINKAMKQYQLTSNHYFIPASPILFNSGSEFPQLASCFLGQFQNDLNKIYDRCKQLANISKRGGGVGVDLSLIQSKGSIVKATGGPAAGIMLPIELLKPTAKHVNQGKRNGSFAIYLPPWHPEIMEFLELRLPEGNEEMRARNLFIAFWNCDLFMERLEKNEKWSLFCPSVIDFNDVYGDKFREKYLQAEKDGLYTRQVFASEIWDKVIVSQEKTGIPYVGNRDTINQFSNQKNIGVIKSSNLCMEVIEFTDDEHISVCNLASIALPKFWTGKKFVPSGNKEKDLEEFDSRDYFKFDKLDRLDEKDVSFMEVVEFVAEMCDRNIDITRYPVDQTEITNLKHRPIGVGVQGYADLIALCEIAWDDNVHFKLNTDIFSAMYYSAIKKSMELAKEYGSYELFKGSPTSFGQFQFDLQGIKPNTRIISMEMWNKLRVDMMIHGLRNSLSIALMPTASTSQILGNNECFEPYTSNLYGRDTLAGNFYIINRHLRNKLLEMGIWNNEFIDRLQKSRGSIENFDDIPLRIREVYRTAWDMSQQIIIDLAADRSPYICQTQSMNLFFKQATKAKLSSSAMYCYKKRLKTMSYYIRSKSAFDAINFADVKDDIGEKIGKIEKGEKGEKVGKKEKKKRDENYECKEFCTA
jgi:ribonucleoside-diphosphate reductase alpha chain